MGPPINTSLILDTLRELNERVSVPLWLFGGVAVDFLVGRWTRPHSDVDLNTYADSRVALTEQLSRIGYRTSDTGWLTHWWQDGTGRGIEVVFLDRAEDGSAELYIPSDASVGIPGRYPLWPGYLDIERIATLDGVSFRVGSPAGEWLGREKTVVAGRAREPKIDHDLALLEAIIPSHELALLRIHASQERANQSPQPTRLTGG
ncbi:MAG: hypothetical protein KF897_13425 [Opitutaceae bacterium]|nr:hypothetical protein [Opitutaceae bacterium]